MKLGIDASNINSGGGLFHLFNILSSKYIDNKKIHKIVVWSSQQTLDKIPDNKKILKKTNRFLNKNLFLRSFWQIFLLSKELNNEDCDVLFTPGSTFVLTKIPVISMCQNLLPFSWNEVKRFGWSFFTLKLILLRFFQSLSFLNSEGIIFLSNFSKNDISVKLNISSKKVKIIPHGVDLKYYKVIKKQHSIKEYSYDRPFKFLYVYHLWPYKNHVTIIRSVSKLRRMGYPIILDLIGGSHAPTLKKINKEINKVNPKSEFIFYHGEANVEKLINFYHQADGFIFGSSCETFGQILTEGMLAGIPIISSKESSMPELLESGCLYYNPFSEQELTKVMKVFLNSDKIRTKISTLAHAKAKKLTWLNCSQKTFSFISEFSNIK